jgi:hypothetical protein
MQGRKRLLLSTGAAFEGTGRPYSSPLRFTPAAT